MSICGEVLESFSGYFTKLSEGGRQQEFPTETSDMVDSEDGDLDGVIRSNENVDDYDIENPHQDIPQGENVRRVDPATLDVLNRNQKGTLN